MPYRKAKRYAHPEERLLANSAAAPDSDCWEWLGRLCSTKGGNKYGRINLVVDGRHVTKWAHRYAFEVFRGEIGEGMHIDHLCGNTVCINPAHLEQIPHKVNCARRDARKARRTW